MIIRLSDYNIDVREKRVNRKESNIPKVFMILTFFFSMYLAGHYFNTSSLIEEKKKKIEELKKTRKELQEKLIKIDFRLNNANKVDYDYVIKILNEDKINEKIEKIKKEIEENEKEKKFPFWIYYICVALLILMRLVYIKNKKRKENATRLNSQRFKTQKISLQ